MINIKRLEKDYQTKKVLNINNLFIESGSIFGLLGPNGAGKTTAIKSLCTLLTPTYSDVTISSLNLLDKKDEIKHKIGYVSQSFSLYGELSVIENIRFYAGLYGVNDEIRFQTLMQMCEIEDFKESPAETLSGGYKRRLALACALVHDPEIIFLDEPTAGIDPLTRKKLWDIFYSLSQDSKTLFVTTHYMEEAERCHKIAFLNHGEVIAKGSPSELKHSLKDYDIYSFKSEFTHNLVKKLEDLDYVYFVNQFGLELRLILKKDVNLEDVTTFISGFTKKKVHLKKTTAELEDVFLALIKDG
ncbi:MAG: ABC transporter ATP-binding protein [Thiovulaceae bacterium]|nr:ABC transporter ATP-binding protein [Sulfurimonadaceae bacterium]